MNVLGFILQYLRRTTRDDCPLGSSSVRYVRPLKGTLPSPSVPTTSHFPIYPGAAGTKRSPIRHRSSKFRPDMNKTGYDQTSLQHLVPSLEPCIPSLPYHDCRNLGTAVLDVSKIANRRKYTKRGS